MNSDPIVYNGIRTPDGTIISSRYRHDFVTHKDANGSLYGVDGGLDYLKRLGPSDYEELSLTVSDGHGKIREHAAWGALRDGEYEWILIKDLEVSHMEAILDGGYAKGVFKQIIKTELRHRPHYEHS